MVLGKVNSGGSSILKRHEEANSSAKLMALSRNLPPTDQRNNTSEEGWMVGGDYWDILCET